MRLADFDLHILPKCGSKIRHEFVEQKDLWLPQDGAADGEPLAPPARWLAGTTVQKVLHLKHARGFCHLFRCLGLRRRGDGQPEGHVSCA